MLGGESPDDAAAIARTLSEKFDPLTIDRAVVELLRSEEPSARAWGTRLFAELGLVDRYSRILRSAPKWSERTQAAEVLGLAGLAQAAPALVAALRDRDEDEGSVKAAASAALAKLRDATAIPLLVKELRETDERSARSVAEALVGFGSLAVPALVELLGDSSHPSGRFWAARVLGRIGDPGAVDELVARLHDRDDRLRVAAAEALGAIGDPRALQAVVRATLRDPAPQVRAHAASAVARIEGERALDVLVAALADPDYATRIRALEAFETMRIEDTSPLETALRDPNLEVRRRAALALERVGYLDQTVGRLSSEDGPTRTRAYAALLEMGHAGLVESIASYVRHPSFEVRAIAARACGELGSAKTVPILLGAIGDDSWPVRAAVCGALGRLCQDAAPPPLVKALADREEAVREAAAEALTNCAPRELEPHLDALAEAYDLGTVAVRGSVVVIAGRIGSARAEALLVRASVDPSDIVRLSAVTALGRGGGDTRIEPLVARLTDASMDVRMAAVTALGSIDRIEAFEGLLRALPGAPRSMRDCIAEAFARGGARAWLYGRLPALESDSTSDVRLGVVWTLGKIGDPSVLPTLGRFLRDPDAALRASAAGALGKILHPAARDALLRAVEDPEGRVRAAVVNALGRIGEGDGTVIAALEQRARDPDGFIRNRATVALARTGKASAEPWLMAHPDGVSLPARLVALALVGTETALAEVLDTLSSPGGLATILAFLESEEPSVRAAFFSSLRLQDPALTASAAEAAELVVQYEMTLRTSLDVVARRLAVAAVERMGALRAIPALVDAVTGDPNETVRLRAAAALADHVGDETARRGLVRAVADPSSEVAIVAAKAIARRSEPEVAAALERRLGAGSAQMQEVVENALADLYRSDPTDFIDWMMGVDVPERLIPAVRVIARMANPATLPLLRELLRSRSPHLRSASVRALTDLDPAQAAPVVDELAEDPSEEVRIAVVDAVKWTANSLTRLARLRRDPSVRVRVHLARALGEARGPSARSAHKVLEGMAADASPAVRAAALASLVAQAEPDGLTAFGAQFSQATLDTRMELRNEPRANDIGDRLAAFLSSSADPVRRRNAVVALGAFSTARSATSLLPALRDPTPSVRIAAIQALASVDDAQVKSRIAELCLDPEASVQEAARRSMLRTVG